MSARNAVVIGGGSGIGRAVAAGLVEDGYRVTVADRDEGNAATVAAEIGAVSARVDVTDESGVEALFADAARGGELHAVVNTAGISSWGPMIDHDVQLWRDVLEVNLVGAFIVLKHAGRAVADGGSLVSLASLNARQPGDGLSAYCASKAGLAMLTQVAALELAPRRIRVNAIAPGLVITPLTEGLQAIDGIEGDYVENTPLGRSGTPEEIAGAARYLCSDIAAWITGEVLDINGGAHLMRYPQLGKHLAAFL
ncbi:SDR family oxidoreductase [Gordonia pseudamarae]|uniref:SDR family oxidoreductase n=1 Tax=Gordonia pseudamarae TaxID=2831662 RepID=A0ABX6IER7_9ACTN|nr:MULTISPECIES: SDR family NAD(P)-dependent oxidoreductase [Gordonia]MBD0021624.1 SDR family oxidoreductase [Gordonia sp. (in: high G+C Gram-positive bacteria)]QHN25388.1 SDR family oxidoreductase [Gordonia pseudamarae]QHN34320.1 SDR family oxidoreductase [Gordonia pseudamarae]